MLLNKIKVKDNLKKINIDIWYTILSHEHQSTKQWKINL